MKEIKINVPNEGVRCLAHKNLACPACNKIKVRKFWGELNPVTRKIESKKKFTRKVKHKKIDAGE